MYIPSCIYRVYRRSAVASCFAGPTHRNFVVRLHAWVACIFLLVVLLVQLVIVPSILFRVLYSSCAFVLIAYLLHLWSRCMHTMFCALCVRVRSHVPVSSSPENPKLRKGLRLLYRNICILLVLHAMTNKQDPSVSCVCDAQCSMVQVIVRIVATAESQVSVPRLELMLRRVLTNRRGARGTRRERGEDLVNVVCAAPLKLSVNQGDITRARRG